MTDVQEIVDLWSKERPKYESLGKAVCAFIKYKIYDYELLPEIQYRTKELLSIIKKVKKKNVWSSQDVKAMALFSVCSGS